MREDDRETFLLIKLWKLKNYRNLLSHVNKPSPTSHLSEIAFHYGERYQICHPSNRLEQSENHLVSMWLTQTQQDWKAEVGVTSRLSNRPLPEVIVIQEIRVWKIRGIQHRVKGEVRTPAALLEIKKALIVPCSIGLVRIFIITWNLIARLERA